MFNKGKTYELRNKGLGKVTSDRKSEVIGIYMNVAIWAIIGGLWIGGVISNYGIVKMLACSGTSKVVKTLINL